MPEPGLYEAADYSTPGTLGDNNNLDTVAEAAPATYTGEVLSNMVPRKLEECRCKILAAGAYQLGRGLASSCLPLQLASSWVTSQYEVKQRQPTPVLASEDNGQ